ncbi:MAG: nucleotidyltransferase domain-containing protein [Chitinispirillales bacterium]|jgi:predicted nucleotidyltransferase|nr:nucleotidyltransferase domain-containing protein [Chitinispirillales bacterium]
MKSHIAEIKNDLELLTQIIVKTVPTEQIYLFGSYAYGTPHEGSDIDLYIVMKSDSDIRELDAIDAANMEIYKRINKPIDLLALKSDKFERKKNDVTMERKIVREGIKIYG